MLSLQFESPNQESIRTLFAESDAFMRSLYPEESCYLVPVEDLLKENMSFVVARLNGVAVGCGAVIQHSDFFELKRMFVSARARGQSVGRKILSVLEERAISLGARVLRLETGPKQDAAIRLYKSFGYQIRGPFGQYKADPNSIFMEKSVHS